jgi:hypothetical protein
VTKLRLLVALIFLGGGGFFFWSSHQAPSFEGPSSDAKLSLWKFQHSTDDAEKMKLAVGLKFRHEALQVSKKSEDLTADERVIEAQAIQLATQVEDEVTLFESRLNRDDIDWITKDNPDSVFRITGELPTRVTECTEQEYQVVRDQVDIRELQARSRDVMSLNHDYEQAFMMRYRARRLELVRTDNRFSEYRNAGEAYYTLSDEAEQKTYAEPGFDERLKSQIAKSEENLERTGLKPEEIRSYVRRLAKLGPHCLSHPSAKFQNSLDSDITVQRAHFLLERLQEYIAVTGKGDATLDDLPLDSGDSIYGSLNDAWSHPFVLVKDASGRLSLKSGETLIQAQTAISQGSR